MSIKAPGFLCCALAPACRPCVAAEAEQRQGSRAGSLGSCRDLPNLQVHHSIKAPGVPVVINRAVIDV